jgi:putative transposase
LFEAKKRFGLSILNYTVTSNHVHLLVVDDASNAISKSIQLVAGRTAQEFNQRKGRKGAYWEDRYHATAVESGEHFCRCLVYIDMNMVRAGAVKHPSEWVDGGYHEIQQPSLRYNLIDRGRLLDLCGFRNEGQFKDAHREWVKQVVQQGESKRQPYWTETIAIGSATFVRQRQQDAADTLSGRQAGDAFLLREPEIAYGDHSDTEKGTVSQDNLVYFDVNAEESMV